MLEGLTYGDSEPCCLGWFVLVVIFVQRSFLLKNLLSSGPAYTSRRGGTCQDVGFLPWSHKRGRGLIRSALLLWARTSGDRFPGSGLTSPLLFGKSGDQNQEES